MPLFSTHYELILAQRRCHCQSLAIHKSRLWKTPTKGTKCGKLSSICSPMNVTSALPTCSFTAVLDPKKLSAFAHKSSAMCKKSIADDVTFSNGCYVMRVTSVGD